MVHAACEALGVPILTSERYEADDVIGTLAVKAAAAGFDVAIVTDGQGLLSARRATASASSTRATKAPGTTPTGVKEKFGVAAGSGRRRAGADGRHHRQHQGRARHRREGRARADRHLRIAREPARARRRGQEQALSRRAARQRRRRAAEPRAGAHPHRRAGRVRPRGAALPRRLARALLPDLQRARVPHARQGVRADRRAPSPRPTASSTPPTACGALAARLARGRDASRCASCPISPAAMRAAIVGLAFSTAPRDADYVPVGHRALGDDAESCRSTSRSTRCAPVLEDAAIAQGRPRPEVRRDRAGAARRHAARARPRHDARELSARRRRGPRTRSKISRSSTPATRR